MKPRLLLLSAVAAAMLAVPALASAATYCVGSPPGCVGTDEGTDLQAALDAALASTSTADQVQIGPAGSPYTRSGGFKYTGASSINPVEIEGVGSPKPTLTMTSDHVGSYQFVLNVQQLGGSSVHDLDFTLPAEDNPAGLDFAASGTVQRISVTNPLNYAGGTGVMISGGTVEDSTFDLGTNGYGVDVRGGTVTPILVQDNTMIGAHGIGLVSSGAPVHVTRNRMAASYIGVQLYGGSAQLDNNLIDLEGANGTFGIYATKYLGQTDVNLDASQLTIRNGGSNSIGVEEDTDQTGSSITVGLRDSIVRGLAHSVVQTSAPSATTLTYTGDHDDYDASTDLPASLGTGQVRNETNLVNVDPLFVNPINGANGLSGDYRLANNSPVIDAGDTAPLDAGETDLAGQPRIVAGLMACGTAVRDLGAYEFQTTCSPPQSPSSSAPSSPAAHKRKCKKRKHRAASAKKCKKRH
jgi:hypothetical protein